MPQGVHAIPILELALPDFGRLDVVAAVARNAPTGALAIELWRFDQNNTREQLEPDGDPSPILRLEQGAKRPAALDELRRRMAAPRSEVYRPVGHAVDDPAALVARLRTAAKAARDPTADAAARAQALADVARGLDDGLLFERDATARVLDALAGDRWQLADVERLSERRSRATVRDGGAPVSLEFARKSGGWALVGIEAGTRTGTGTGT